jgi:hypothetical protein
MTRVQKTKPAIALAGAIALWAGTGGLATADSLGINFEAPAYTPGSIQSQQGWGGQTPPGIPINPAIDQAIVVNGPSAPASFGAQSWRISNSYTAGSFGDMPFSPSLKNEAGETMAQNSIYSGGTRQNHFDVRWAFASADPTGPGTDCSSTSITCSYLSMAPDRGDGARMSYIRLEDDTSGLRVFFDDYQDKAPYGAYGSPATAANGCGVEDDFIETMVASGLDRTKAHTVALSLDFVDGPRNDVVKVYVDGNFVHKGTSWEDYFRWCTESGGGTGTTAADQSRTVDSMIFTVRGGTLHPNNAGKGFLIDNLAYASSMADQCDNRHGNGDGDVQDGSGKHAHMHFQKDGCGKHDGDNVQHNDGQGHNFQSSSVDSAQYSTAADGRTVAMTGTGLDNGIPVSFTLVAIDHDGLVPAAYSLVLSDGYAFIGILTSGTLSV